MGNTEVARALYEGFAAGDAFGVRAVMGPEIIWIQAAGTPYAGTFIGPDEVDERVLAKLGSEWTDYSTIPDDYIAEGHTVCALGTSSGMNNASGLRFEARFVHVLEINGSKIVHFEQIVDSAMLNAALPPPLAAA